MQEGTLLQILQRLKFYIEIILWLKFHILNEPISWGFIWATKAHPKRNSLNSLLYIKEIKFVVKKFIIKKIQCLDGFTDEIYQTFKEEIIPILHKPFQNVRGRSTSPHSLRQTLPW